MQGYIVGMTVPYMPEEKQAVIRAKIGLFELRLPRRGKENRLIIGPYNVDVRENVDAKGDHAPTVKWKTDPASCIEYTADRKGNLMSWMPDDPWWHNRIYIIDNPTHVINMVNLHTHLGIIAGGDAHHHIRILQDMLKEKVEIQDLFIDGRLFGSAPNVDKGNEEIEKRRKTFTTLKDGRLEIAKSKDHAFEMKPRMVLKYKSEIHELIQRAKKEQAIHWTRMPEFANEIKPAVIKEIKRLGLEPVKVGDIGPKNIIDAVGGMTDVQRKDLFEKLTGQPAPKAEEKAKVAAPKAKKKKVTVGV